MNTPLINGRIESNLEEEEDFFSMVVTRALQTANLQDGIWIDKNDSFTKGYFS